MPLNPHASFDLPRVDGATFDHFAIATPRIRNLLPLWQDAMGGQFVIGADNPEVGWRTARFELGSTTCVELIEPLPGSSFLDGFLRKNPRGGVHHVTFLVDDVHAAFLSLADRGFEPFGADASWFQLFVHPRQANGVLLQLMCRHDYSTGPMELEELLAGRGINGIGVPSP